MRLLWCFNSSFLSSNTSKPSSSNAEEDSEPTSICGEDVSAEQASNPSSIYGEGGSAEEDSSDSRGLTNSGGESAEVTAYSPENLNSQLVRQATSEERSSGSPNLDVGLWSTLDDHLLEKIIVRLPLKSFFQASSSLSKRWTLRFHSPSFQLDLYKSSSSWESYCPLYMNDAKELVGYEIGSKRWHRLPTHSYLPQEIDSVRWGLRAGTGSLFCWTCPYLDYWYRCHIFVTNPLTRSWKQLPLRPEMHSPQFVHIDLEGNKAYKVILSRVTRLETPRGSRLSIRVQIFDSTENSWTIEVYILTGTNITRNVVESTFMNGILHVLIPTFPRVGFTLICLDVQKKVWSKIPVQLQAMAGDLRPGDQLLLSDHINFDKVCVCGTHMVMAINYEGNVSNMGFVAGGDHGNTCSIFSVFKVDVDRGLACEVSRAPSHLLGLISASQHLSTAVAHGDCMYISCTSSSSNESLLLVYNVGTRQWDEVPSIPDRSPPFSQITSTTYRPGLNPFLEV